MPEMEKAVTPNPENPETLAFDPKREKAPWFRVTQAPGFATGRVMHVPGTMLEWSEPEGWDEKKYGKHYSKYGPSMTFEPLNKAAEDLLAKHKENVQKKFAPVPSDIEKFMGLMREMMAQNQQLIAALVESKKK